MVAWRSWSGPFSAALVVSLATPAITRAQATHAGDQPSFPPRTALPAAQPALAQYRRGFLCLLHVGINDPVGDTQSAYLPGFRVGSFLGYNLPRFLSINAELSIDVLNARSPFGTGYNVSETVFDLALSPLLHFGPANWVIVGGPKLGFFRHSSHSGSQGGYWYGNDQDFTGGGWSYGINLGAFFALDPVALGGILNFTGHAWLWRCENDFSTGHVDACDGLGHPNLHTLGLTVAMLF